MWESFAKKHTFWQRLAVNPKFQTEQIMPQATWTGQLEKCCERPKKLNTRENEISCLCLKPLRSSCRFLAFSSSYFRFHSAASAWAEAFPSATRLSAFATAKARRQSHNRFILDYNNWTVNVWIMWSSLKKEIKHTSHSFRKLYKMLIYSLKRRLKNFLHCLFWTEEGKWMWRLIFMRRRWNTCIFL